MTVQVDRDPTSPGAGANGARLEFDDALAARVVPREVLLEKRPRHVPAQPVEVVGAVAGDQAGPRHRLELPPLRLLGPVEQSVVDHHVTERVEAEEIAAGRRAGERIIRPVGGGQHAGDVPGHGGTQGEKPLAPFTIRFQWLMDMKVK